MSLSLLFHAIRRLRLQSSNTYKNNYDICLVELHLILDFLIYAWSLICYQMFLLTPS
jgi:hypothetical protein